MTECPVCKSTPKFVTYEKLTIGHCPNWCKLHRIKQNYVVTTGKNIEKLWDALISKYEKKKHGSEEYRFIRLYGKEEFQKAFGKNPEVYL
jgi:hypothetical protein